MLYSVGPESILKGKNPTMQKKSPDSLTIADVAKKAGCSIATASRVLSASKYPVANEMRERILEAAAGLGYSTNLKKRMLLTNQNPFIGIIVPTLQNPRYLQFIAGIEQAARKEKFTALVMNSQRSTQLERLHINSMIKKRIGSMMLMSVDESAAACQHYLDMGGIVCLLESNFPDPAGVISAKVGRFEAGRLATEYLLSQGHRSIAFLSSPLKYFQSRKLTLDGCRFAMEKHALPFSADNLFVAADENEADSGMYEYDAGFFLAEKVLRHARQFTAIVALNDMIALGVIAGMRAAGANVPYNVSVIGIDDLPLSQIASPALTTVNTSAQVLGQRAAQLIIRASGSLPEEQRSNLSFKPELVIRESVRKL